MRISKEGSIVRSKTAAEQNKKRIKTTTTETQTHHVAMCLTFRQHRRFPRYPSILHPFCSNSIGVDPTNLHSSETAHWLFLKCTVKTQPVPSILHPHFPRPDASIPHIHSRSPNPFPPLPLNPFPPLPSKHSRHRQTIPSPVQTPFP